MSFGFYDPSITWKCTQPNLMKPLWGGHPARPQPRNMTFMNLINEFNELTLTEIC